MYCKRCYFFLCLFLSIPFLGFSATNHWETPISADSTWNYFIGVSAPPTDWYTSAFNDQAWLSAKGGIGYGDITLANGTPIAKPAASLFLRKNFNVTDTSAIVVGVLSMDYDDAFVAFINGVEVARSSGLTDTHPAYGTFSTVSHESTKGGNPEVFNLTLAKLRAVLQPGKNYLAIQVHNENLASSDLVAISYLSFGIKNTNTYFPTTPAWLAATFPLVPIVLDYTSSNLPIIKINTNGKAVKDEPKIIATLGIIDNGAGVRNNVTDPFNNFSGTIGIEFRGATSQMFASKKSYGFETWNADSTSFDTELLGMPMESDWTLYAEYLDNTMLNNTLAYALGNSMGRWAPRTLHTELFLNNKYQGVYELIEKLKRDKNRLNIASMKPTDIAGDDVTGGYIIAIDRGYDATLKNGFISKDTAAYKKSITYVYVYPKIEDITTEQKNYIHDYVDKFEAAAFSSTFKDPINGYAKYIDVASFIDYFIINELSKNVDGYRISAYFHKDKDSKGGKLTAGPLWDYNLAFGNPNSNYYTGTSYIGWMFNQRLNNTASWGIDGSQIPLWWPRLYSDPNFQNQLKTRWTDIRKTFLSYDSIASFLDQKAAIIAEAEKRDAATWSTKYVHTSHLGEVEYMKSWIANRLTWMDTNMLGTAVNIPKTENFGVTIWPNPFFENVNFRIGSPQNGDVSIAFYDLTGRKINVLTESNVDNATTMTWNGDNGVGNTVSNGVYIYRISINNIVVKTGKLIKSGN